MFLSESCPISEIDKPEETSVWRKYGSVAWWWEGQERMPNQEQVRFSSKSFPVQKNWNALRQNLHRWSTDVPPYYQQFWILYSSHTFSLTVLNP